MRDLDLTITVDSIGNVVGVMDGEHDGQPVMTGSHIDTVRTGGRYDGNLGVLAGLEVIETLRAAGITPLRGLAVAFFTDEEGRFPPDMLGSLVYVGGMSVEEAPRSRASTAPPSGANSTASDIPGCTPPAPHAYVELHVEQARCWRPRNWPPERSPASGHRQDRSKRDRPVQPPGTTPMALHKDPVVAFRRRHSSAIWPVNSGPRRSQPSAACICIPTWSTSPATAEFTIDLRHTDNDVLLDAERRTREFLLGRQLRATVTTKSLARFDPVEFDDAVVACVEQAALTQATPCAACHPAPATRPMLARVCPTGMIFVPSVNGLSHNPAEYTSPADLEAGANVLLQVMLERRRHERNPDGSRRCGGWRHEPPPPRRLVVSAG